MPDEITEQLLSVEEDSWFICTRTVVVVVIDHPVVPMKDLPLKKS